MQGCLRELWLNKVGEIGAIEGGFKDRDILKFEVVNDILLNKGGSRSSKTNNGWLVAQAAEVLSYVTVFRTKVVTPFRDTMGLINGNQGDINRIKKGLISFNAKPFRRYIDELCLTLVDFRLDLSLLSCRDT